MKICLKERVRHQGSRVSRREGAIVPSVTERTGREGIKCVHGTWSLLTFPVSSVEGKN